MRKHLSHQRPVSVAVHDRKDLVATCPFSSVRSLQGRTRKGLIHITRDSVRLVNREGAVNQRGYALEGVHVKVALGHVRGKGINLYPGEVDASFVQRQADNPRIDT